MPIRPQEFILDSKNVFRVKQINLLSILFAGRSLDVLMFAIVCSLMICFNLVFSVISIFLFYRCFCSFHICRNLKRFYVELLEIDSRTFLINYRTVTGYWQLPNDD